MASWFDFWKSLELLPQLISMFCRVLVRKMTSSMRRDCRARVRSWFQFSEVRLWVSFLLVIRRSWPCVYLFRLVEAMSEKVWLSVVGWTIKWLDVKLRMRWGAGSNNGIMIIRYRVLFRLSAKRSTLDILRSDNRSSEILWVPAVSSAWLSIVLFMLIKSALGIVWNR